MDEWEELVARRSREVWVFDGHPGFREAIRDAGGVAAPLLAGFSLTLLVLLLPELGESGARASGAAASHDEPFSAFPGLAGFLLLLAGLLLIATVQASIYLRYHSQSPAQIEEWYPEYFVEGEQPSTEAQPPEWSTDDWPALRAGGKWYGGWARKFLSDATATANTAAKWTRRLYHFGILALLGGVTALVTPPGGDWTAWRTVMFATALGGTVGELFWILRANRRST
jgi:hypothetical protein